MPLLSALELYGTLESGELRALFVRSSEGVAVIVVQERGRWRQLMAAHGAEGALLQGLAALRDSSDALLWDEGTLRVEPAALDGLGYTLLQRQAFTQELARVPVAEDPPDLEVSPLTDSVLGEARELFGRTHAMNVEGMYTTFPERPTQEKCEAAFDGYLSGAEGPPVPSACVVIRSQGRVVGVICCAADETEGTAILLGLAVDPSERGRGLSRVLVRRAQRALLASGFPRMLFLTTDRNTPVHRLFTPEEIVATETFPARVWFREAPERMMKAK